MPEFLNMLNHSVKEFEDSLPVNSSPPHSIFIIGVPRSGTTLVSQLLSACTNVGYVNNLMARFWMAPSVGACLSQEVLRRCLFTGLSNYGQTQAAEEPHEFGAFWRKMLNYENMDQKETDDDIDWNDLVVTLKRVASAFNKPVVYKVFQLYWHLKAVHDYLPDSKWIWVRRNPVENALSLLHMRKEKTGGIETWFSARPLGALKYDNEPAWVQVAAQVKFIEDWIEGQLTKIPSNASLKVDLDELCEEPERITRDIADSLNLPIYEKRLENIANKISPEIFDEKEDALKGKIEQVFQGFFN